MTKKEIMVRKASGKLEAFSEDKVRRSLARAGVNIKVINKIIKEVTPKIHQGMTTKEIYQHVFELLEQYEAENSYNYSLKDALMKLGPSGFPFEKFIGRLFEKLGYESKVSNIISGSCLSYEIDVVISKDGKRDLVECKYHNRSGTKTQSKDVLCLQAKFEDIGSYDRAWLVTNTRLTTSAIKYAKCKGIKLLAWRYPEEEGLEKLIERFNLQPITALNFLSHQEQRILIENNIIAVSDLLKLRLPEIEKMGFNQERSKRLYDFVNLQNTKLS